MGKRKIIFKIKERKKNVKVRGKWGMNIEWIWMDI